ncbi:MAG: hypothetical protein ACRY3E_05960 [Candidatus Lariskella arthropodorum]
MTSTAKEGFGNTCDDIIIMCHQIKYLFKLPYRQTGIVALRFRMQGTDHLNLKARILTPSN